MVDERLQRAHRPRTSCGHIGRGVRRLALIAVALLALSAGSALAARVRLVVSPVTVVRGATLQVSTTASPCRSGDQVTVISAAFPGHAFGGEGAIYGKAGSHGAFTVRGRVGGSVRPGPYTLGVRCGGGNLGVTAAFMVVAK